jgi:hypothetical protein
VVIGVTPPTPPARELPQVIAAIDASAWHCACSGSGRQRGSALPETQEENVHIRHVCLRAAGITMVAMLAACSSSDKSSVRSISVTAAARSASTYQMTARADMSDGSSRDVTGDAQWTSSNPDIATVAAGGVLTVLHSGQIEVRATYQNTTGSMSLTVSAPQPPSTLIILSGLVTETPPGGQPIAGVTIRITDGPGAGRSTMTDSQGRYGFTEFPAGQIGIEAVKAGYVTWRMNTSLDHDREIQIVMFPTPPTDSSGATATARCNDGTWSWAQTSASACTSNGGIAYPVCPGPLCASQTAR